MRLMCAWGAGGTVLQVCGMALQGFTYQNPLVR